MTSYLLYSSVNLHSFSAWCYVPIFPGGIMEVWTVPVFPCFQAGMWSTLNITTSLRPSDVSCTGECSGTASARTCTQTHSKWFVLFVSVCLPSVCLSVLSTGSLFEIGFSAYLTIVNINAAHTYTHIQTDRQTDRWKDRCRQTNKNNNCCP